MRTAVDQPLDPACAGARRLQQLSGVAGRGAVEVSHVNQLGIGHRDDLNPLPTGDRRRLPAMVT
jgi:hypothetical protein